MTDTNRELSRREFVAASLSGLTAAGLAALTPGVARAEEAKTTAPPKKNGVIFRKLGRTGLEVPVVSMGAGASNDPNLVEACYEAGMRLFDTSPTYAYGRNEQMIANVITRLGVRDKAIYVTKGLTTQQRANLNNANQTEQAVRSTVEGSLKRLKTDYADILCLYDVREPGTMRDAAINDAFARMKQEGKAKFLGISTHADMANVINATVEAGIYDVIVTSFNFTMATDTALMTAIANAAAKGIGIIAMKVLAGGARFPNPETLQQYPGTVVNSAALKWVLRNENIATTIPGIDNFDHLRANFAIASDITLTAEESRFLSDNNLTLGMEFCRQCKKCLASCPKKADIPNLMRTHMYATQYANFELARHTLNEIPNQHSLQVCGSCSSCAAKCANSVNIGRKIDELKLIYA
ncbi:MAG: aldo/keto reductase [candidate division Zixibacteria bacterium]|nr:aldo/keto reductase [candidate division Zixibacteria bacterium]